MRAFMRWMKGIMFKMPSMITCAEAEGFIVDYLEGDLHPAKVKVFEMHLKLCRECRDYLQAYKTATTLGKAAFQNPEGDAADVMPEDFVKAIEDAQNA